jgi:hypothetical protein
MPMTLQTVLARIPSVPNQTNGALLSEFHEYMKNIGASERHQKNELYQTMLFAYHLGPNTTFFDVTKSTEVLAYLDTKKKTAELDPDQRWITTWNDYLNSIKHFYRWLYNQRTKEGLTDPSDWETPKFVQIKQRKSKRLSPYSETEIWEREELLLVIKYATHRRNKAALALFWDLDARNHEVTNLELRHLRLKDQYAEGEVPFQSKTGSGPILLTVSFPYVRDWLNEHPFSSNPRAKVICSLKNGAPVKSEAMWSMMKSLRKRIVRLLKKGQIADPKEREQLEHLLKTKKWNPYCIRHSAITFDSDSLPEFALRKKVRWSMNSKQPGRYVKRRMGDGLKRQILQRDGIIVEDIVEKPTVRICARCKTSNSIENKYCSSATCGYPLTVEAYEERKAEELETKKKIDIIFAEYGNVTTILRGEIEDLKRKLAEKESSDQ